MADDKDNIVIGELNAELAGIDLQEKDGFALLPIELLENIFIYLDHDSLLAMLTQSRHIAITALPFLREKRHEIISELYPKIDELKSSISLSEKYLKRVLRTNEDLTYQAFNIQLDRCNKKCKFAVPLMLSPSLLNKNDMFSLFEIACQLDKIAQAHCYGYLQKRQSMHCFEIVRRKYQLGSASKEQLSNAFIFHVFQEFMKKYPLLSKFTSVEWPESMREWDRMELAKEHARRKTGHRSYRIGRMRNMKLYGTVKSDEIYPKPYHPCPRYYPYPYMKRTYYYDEYE